MYVLSPLSATGAGALVPPTNKCTNGSNQNNLQSWSRSKSQYQLTLKCWLGTLCRWKSTRSDPAQTFAPPLSCKSVIIHCQGDVKFQPIENSTLVQLS
jgi:hypothetical protein